jgi:hypothetical protein
MKPRK